MPSINGFPMNEGYRINIETDGNMNSFALAKTIATEELFLDAKFIFTDFVWRKYKLFFLISKLIWNEFK